MSLLWPKKHLRIGLGPDRVMVAGAKAIEVPEADGGWESPLKILPELIKPHSGEASIVLADQFVRYVLLPWNETLKTHEQWQALAKHRFAGLHGAARAAEWKVEVSETAPAGARLACAVDRSLVENLASLFTANGLKLVSVQPFLVAAYNRIRATVGNGSCWVVVEERGRLTLVLIRRGAWLAIRSRRSDERWRIVLPEILERESAFLGLSEPCTRVVVCAQNGFDTQMHERWRAHALSYRDLALATD